MRAPVPEQTVFPTNTDVGRITTVASPEAFGAQVAEATGAIGAAQSDQGDMLARHALAFQELNNETEAKEGQSKFLGALSKLDFDYYSLTGKAAVDGRDNYIAGVQNLRQSMLASMSNPITRHLLDDSLSWQYGRALIDSSKHAAEQRHVWMDDVNTANTKAITDSLINRYNDDAYWATGINALKSNAEQFGGQNHWTLEQVQALERKNIGDAWNLRIKRVNEDSPAGALKMLEANKDQIDAETYVGLGSVIKSALQQQQMEARARLMETRADTSVNLLDEQASLRDTGKPIYGFTADQIKAIFPPAEAAHWNRTLQSAADGHRINQEVFTASPAEIQANVARLTAGLNEPSAAEKAAELTDYMQAVKQRDTELHGGDSATYVYRYDPGVQATLAAALQDPKKMPVYATMLDHDFDQLGVLPDERQLFPKPVAQQLVQNLTSLPPQKRADAIMGMAQAYGPLWPRVLGSMVKDGGLPTAYEFLPALGDPTSRTVFANALSDPKGIKGSLNTPDVATIDDTIDGKPTPDTNLASLGSSFGYASGGAAKFSDLKDSIKLLAFGYASMGMSADKATQTAIAAITTEKYDFGQNADGSYFRVPARNLAAAQLSTANLLAKLQPADLAPLRNTLGIAGLTPAQLQQSAVDKARAGHWRTAEDDQGLVLYGPDEAPILRADGSRLEFRFAGMAGAPSARVTGLPDLGTVRPAARP